MFDVYEYREEAHRPVAWAAAALMGFMAGLMIWQAAPWYAWLAWLPTSVVVTFCLARHPLTGIRLTRDDLTHSPCRVPKEIALADVDFVRIVDWSDSTDVEVHMTNGRATRIQHCDMPPREAFIAVLRARDVAVEVV